MPKRFYVLLFFLMPIAFSYAQTKKIVVIGKVFYDFTYQYDTTNKENPFRDILVLNYGKEGSLFRSNSFFESENSSGKVRIQDGAEVIQFPRGSQDIYYTNNLEKGVVRIRYFFNKTYLMTDTFPPTSWNISSETKKIDSFVCQKATTYFRGRLYTAWFCPDILYSYGPWKLNGLPGIILEVSDSKKEVVFSFNHFENIFQSPETFEPIKKFVSITESAFESRREELKSNNAISLEGYGLITGTLSNSQGREIKAKKTPAINNPIDLITKLPLMF